MGTQCVVAEALKRRAAAAARRPNTRKRRPSSSSASVSSVAPQMLTVPIACAPCHTHTHSHTNSAVNKGGARQRGRGSTRHARAARAPRRAAAGARPRVPTAAPAGPHRLRTAESARMRDGGQACRSRRGCGRRAPSSPP
jgi:hypothetical protein